MSTVAIKRRINQASSKTIPTVTELDRVLTRLMPQKIRAGLARSKQPGDFDLYKAWAEGEAANEQV